MRERVVLATVLGIHLAVALTHGATHALVPVGLPSWLNGVVLVTTFLGPVVGVALVWRERPLGEPVFTLSMVGALLVGGVLHFLVENRDHVHEIPGGPWQLPFQVSAGGVALTAALGVAVGAWYWYGRGSRF